VTDLVAARVRVPCSTSNLGSGYDTVGLALDRHLDASFIPDDGGLLHVERTGSLARLARTEPDLVAATFEAKLRERGREASGVLRLHAEVPVARGLGTSAAAVVAGCDLARASRGEPPDRDEAFAAALRHEGHGDNAAPSVFGGLRAVTRTADGLVVIELVLSERVGFAYAAPSARISTREARELLPKHVPHELAAVSLGRVVALVRGLAEADPELIRIGVADELHVSHRLPLIPGAAAVMAAGVDAGAWAVTVSGAGSGLIALCDPADAENVAAAMHHVFDAGTGDPECVGFAVRPSMEGMRRVTEP
jgi:homoserine kinase